MKEATELMAKMKSMPGMKNMKKMFGEMGLPIGKNSKINMNAFQSHMNRNMRKANARERMKAKLAARKAAASKSTPQQPEVFSTGETVERTPVGAEKPVNREDGTLSKSQKKRKKKKAKAKAGQAESCAE